MKNMKETKTKIGRLSVVGILVLAVFLVSSISAAFGQVTTEIVVAGGYEAEILATSKPGFVYNDLTFSPSGDLIVSVGAESRRPCDSYIASISQSGLETRFADICIDAPSAVAFNPFMENLLFFTDQAGYWNRVFTVPLGGTPNEVRVLASGFVLPLDLAFAPNGELYVADVWFGTVYKLNTQGLVTPFVGGFTKDTTGYPLTYKKWLGIAFDSAGLLYVSDGGAGTIYKVLPDGQKSVFASGFILPTGIAFSPNGDLFVADTSVGAVYSLSQDGVTTLFASGFYHPVSLAFDQNGDLYVFEESQQSLIPYSWPPTRIIKIALSKPLIEKSFTESTLLETLRSQKALLNVSVSGDFSSTLNFTNFEIASITTGPFAGKGFSKGEFETTLEGITYKGGWKGALFLKPQEKKIYLKGAISGEISATVEGYLTESVPENGIYDQYQATWKIGRLGTTTTSATIKLNGILSYQSDSEFPSTEL